MQQLDYRHSRRGGGFWNRIVERLVYLPGALVLMYGFWLSLSG